MLAVTDATHTGQPLSHLPGCCPHCPQIYTFFGSICFTAFSSCVLLRIRYSTASVCFFFITLIFSFSRRLVVSSFWLSCTLSSSRERHSLSNSSSFFSMSAIPSWVCIALLVENATELSHRVL